MTSTKSLVIILLVVMVLFALPQPARAQKAISVGDGTAASCTEAALRNALTLAGGETSSIIRFKCGPGATTITVTATLTVPNGTTINGDGLITLNGRASLFVLIGPSTAIVLKQLTITGTGVGIWNQGTLTVHESRLAHNVGAIINDGALTVHNSAFEGNHGGLDILGACILNRGGNVTVHDSAFSENSSIVGGAIRSDGGTLTIKDSTLSDNLSEFGGGIDGGGTLTIVGSTFSGNKAAFRGGAINWGGTINIKESTFSGNSVGEGSGGAISASGTITISGSLFQDNVVKFRVPVLGQIFGGGAIAFFGQGTLVVRDSIFTENAVASFGGAILNFGVLSIRDSTITNNTAQSDGGGIYTCCGGSAELIQTTVTDNVPNDIVP